MRDAAAMASNSLQEATASQGWGVPLANVEHSPKLPNGSGLQMSRNGGCRTAALLHQGSQARSPTGQIQVLQSSIAGQSLSLKGEAFCKDCILRMLFINYELTIVLYRAILFLKSNFLVFCGLHDSWLP